MQFRIFLTFWLLISIDALIDQCNINSADCNPGKCVWRPSGNRCQCTRGLMGSGCKRPCQDVYKSCARWKRERRCEVKRTTFFLDNCALTCQDCESDGKRFVHALPAALEPLSWLVGKWEAKIFSRYRFPILSQLPSNYTEVMDIQPTEPSMFDRPSLNYRFVLLNDAI
ncbi:hypothetical protein M3Y97_00054500 [Aphelenchoides bicaudatus]|nr:hypothetical protein M3Y97_00054500 [Aphelenchoides bicaudatus]